MDEDQKKSDRVSLWSEQVNNGQLLEFRKSKFLGQPTGVYWLPDLDRLEPGSRVTFRWVNDHCEPNDSKALYLRQFQLGSYLGANMAYQLL